jgi:aryl-alcohol dehydrogenase-like predicted oxidoreductase
MKSERTIGQVLRQLLQHQKTELQRDEIFVSTKAGYVPDDADNGIPAKLLIDTMIEEGKITEKDVAGGIHCMHPNFLANQLEASRKNLGLNTIDLVYLQNSYEQ